MNLDVRHEEAQSRYVLVADTGEQIGLIDYRLRDRVVDMVHTETDPAHGGQGYGSLLVKGALDDVRRIGGLKVKPTCPFVATYIERHPEYQDLLA